MNFFFFQDFSFELSNNYLFGSKVKNRKIRNCFSREEFFGFYKFLEEPHKVKIYRFIEKCTKYSVRIKLRIFINQIRKNQLHLKNKIWISLITHLIMSSRTIFRKKGEFTSSRTIFFERLRPVGQFWVLFMTSPRIYVQ